jgi:repressor LexA
MVIGTRRKRDVELLEYVRRFIARHGYSPSYAEMCRGVGLRSKGSIFNLLGRLRDEGKIEVRDNMARTVRLIDRKGVKGVV